MPVNPKAFGRRLAQARVAAGFDSRRSFAAAMKVSHTMVGYWETGQHLPRPAQVRALAKKLNDPELVELAGLTSEHLTSSSERLDVLEERLDSFMERETKRDRFVKKLGDELERIRRQLEAD